MVCLSIVGYVSRILVVVVVVVFVHKTILICIGFVHFTIIQHIHSWTFVFVCVYCLWTASMVLVSVISIKKKKYFSCINNLRTVHIHMCVYFYLNVLSKYCVSQQYFNALGSLYAYRLRVCTLYNIMLVLLIDSICVIIQQNSPKKICNINK